MKCKVLFAEEISMAIVNMETGVTLDMPNKFALTAIVTSFSVKTDTLESVNGFRSTTDVNLQHSVNLACQDR